jgi:hypothetical protein
LFALPEIYVSILFYSKESYRGMGRTRSSAVAHKFTAPPRTATQSGKTFEVKNLELKPYFRTPQQFEPEELVGKIQEKPETENLVLLSL